jgi:hypothetical protein
MLGTSPKNSPWLKSKKSAALEYLKKPDLTKWKQNAGIALFIYAQVIEDYGWGPMNEVLTLCK